MANSVQPLNLMDFRGGLNLRSSDFALGENEASDILNMEVDPRAGLASRKGWQRWNSSTVTADTWNPRNAVVHERSNGVDVVMVSNAERVHWSTDGAFQELTIGAGADMACTASPHLADYAPWGNDVYIARGKGQLASSWDSSSANAVELSDCSTVFGDDYLSPVGSSFPKCEHATEHAGRMWVAHTTETTDGDCPFRVRWSYPNDPESWLEDDYIDIKAGGGPITAIIPHDDHLLVFKKTAVFALFGYGQEDLQRVDVDLTVGTLSPQTVAVADGAVFFVSFPKGVFSITGGGHPQEVSMALRPLFGSDDFNASALDNMWLGWLGRRLWWSVPYKEDELVSDAASIFVLDPSMNAWTKFRSASGEGLGPFAAGAYGQGSVDLYGFCRCGPNVVRVDIGDAGNDNLSGTPIGFPTSYTTGWLHAGWPDLKKRWRRPTFIARKQSGSYSLTCSVFANYETQDVKRQFTVLINALTGVALYGDGSEYDDGTRYAIEVSGSTLKKASSLGTMAATQLKIDGTAGEPWGLDGIVFKYRARRFN